MQPMGNGHVIGPGRIAGPDLRPSIEAVQLVTDPRSEAVEGECLQTGADLAGQQPALGTSTLPFIVNLAGRSEDSVVKGRVSNRCTGSFAMRKQ